MGSESHLSDLGQSASLMTGTVWDPMNSLLTKVNGTSSAAVAPPTHIISVDVEDYFMVEAFASTVSHGSWESRPSRILANTLCVLDLFDEYNVKGTFFFVGWVAHKFPELVREVHARGHEIACHSYWHRTVYSLTPGQFREDTRMAVQAIEDAAGIRVQGYRAPSWSITKNSIWALDILAEEGFTYDSSIFPIHHDLYGIPGAQRFPYVHHCPNGKSLRELPPTTVRMWGQNLPGAGGGYLRICPLSYTEWIFRKFEDSYGQRVVVYFHPWELDPAQPRMRESLKSRLRHYTNLGKMRSRLEHILGRYSFESFSAALTHAPSEHGESEFAPVLTMSPEPTRTT
jgi:polysaccharide deacetylase family protein (PEP-CTERM system associated)